MFVTGIIKDITCPLLPITEDTACGVPTPKMRSGMDILVGSARMRRNVYNRLIDLTGAYSSMGEFMIDHSQTGRHGHYMVKPYLVLRDCHRIVVTGIIRAV